MLDVVDIHHRAVIIRSGVVVWAREETIEQSSDPSMRRTSQFMRETSGVF
jgi:hypothetical protein